MLANLPAKRATRTIVSLKDGIRKTNRKQVTNNKNAKVKCGKVIYRKKAANNVQQANANLALAKTKNTTQSAKGKFHSVKENAKNGSQNTLTRRKSLRCINKVLSSRILDTNATLVIKRKLKSAINSKNISESDAKLPETDTKPSTENESNRKTKKAIANQKKEKSVTPSTSPDLHPAKKSHNTATKTVAEKIKSITDKKHTNIKNFFPVTKPKNAQRKPTSKSDNKKVTQKSKTKDGENVQTTQIKQSADSAHNNIIKKSRLDIIGNFMRTLSVRTAKTDAKPIERDERKPSVKRKLRDKIQNVIKKVRPNKKKLEVKVDGSPREPSNGGKNDSNHFLEEAVEEPKEVGEEDDKMPHLEKVPETPEKCEDIKDLPILTPAVLNFNTFTTKNNQLFHLETTENEKANDASKESVKENDNNKSVGENTKYTTENSDNNYGISNKSETAKTTPDLAPTEPKLDVKINFNLVPKNSGNISENKSFANPKTKQKKPRRLNDCIAMLTSKLQQKVMEEKVPETNDNRIFLPTINFVNPPIQRPIFGNAVDAEEEVLDLSISKKEEALSNAKVSDNNEEVTNICEEKNEEIVVENDTEEKEAVEAIDRQIDELLLTDKMKELIQNALNEVAEEVPHLNGRKIQDNKELLMVEEEREVLVNIEEDLATNEEQVNEKPKTKPTNANRVSQKKKKRTNKKAAREITNTPEIVEKGIASELTNDGIIAEPFDDGISDEIGVNVTSKVVKQAEKERNNRPKRKGKWLHEKESAIDIDVNAEEKIEVLPNGILEISPVVTPKLRPKRRSRTQQKEMLKEISAIEIVVETSVEKKDDEVLNKIPVEELNESKMIENDRVIPEETKLEEISSKEQTVEVQIENSNECLDKTNETLQLNGSRASQKRKKNGQQTKTTRQKKTRLKTNNNINANEPLPEIQSEENTIITEDLNKSTERPAEEEPKTTVQKEIYGDEEQKINNNDFDGIEEHTASEKLLEDSPTKELENLESQILEKVLKEVNQVNTEQLDAFTEKLPAHPSDSEDELPLAALIKSSNNNQNSSGNTNEEISNSDICEINSETVPLLNDTSFQKPAARTRKARASRKAINKNRKSNKKPQVCSIPEETANRSCELSEISEELNDSLSSKSIEEEPSKIDCLPEISLDKSLNLSNKDISLEDEKSNSEENILEKTLQDATNLTTSKKQISKKQNGKKNCISGIQNNPFEFLDIWDDKEKESEWLFQSAIKAQANALNAATPVLKDDLRDEIESPIFKIKPKNSPKRTKKVKNAPPPPPANDSREFFCDICSKSFVRNDNLIKHFKTLKHIAKLSEIEAKQALESNAAKNVTDMSEGDINICNILHNAEKYVEEKIAPASVVSSTFSINTAKNDTLKLADIINDVLNKPVEDISNKHGTFSNIILQSPEDGALKPKTKRCKSLGERKSFESDNVKSTNFGDFDNFSTTTLENNIFTKSNNVSTDAMLEKQISLLENIIENRKSLNYLDDISISPTRSVVENPSPSELSSASDRMNFEESNVLSASMKLATENDFLKPVQYEEISGDSVDFSNGFEDQKSRKALNRDEELFLECCSLLKSGSEISNYSKRSSKVAGRARKACGGPALEPDVLEHKNFSIRREFGESSHFMSDASR